jgi:hypothetical protein
MVHEGALFLPASTGAGLTITGGIICGTGILPQVAVLAAPGPCGILRESGVTTRFGLELWGTTVQYDPRYLKKLNVVGGYSVLLWRHLQ